MKLSMEEISHENEEEVIVRCYDTQENGWKRSVRLLPEKFPSAPLRGKKLIG